MVANVGHFDSQEILTSPWNNLNCLDLKKMLDYQPPYQELCSQIKKKLFYDMYGQEHLRSAVCLKSFIST